jgi:hypothetical protein
MTGRALRVLIPVGLTLLVVSMWNDVIRYAKIKQLDLGRGGRPEIVPAEGRKAYPQHPGEGTPDGTGEFDSARRGGPGHAA